MDSRTKFYGSFFAMLALSSVALNGFPATHRPPLESPAEAPTQDLNPPDPSEETLAAAESDSEISTDPDNPSSTSSEESSTVAPPNEPTVEATPQLSLLDFLFRPIEPESR